MAEASTDEKSTGALLNERWEACGSIGEGVIFAMTMVAPHAVPSVATGVFWSNVVDDKKSSGRWEAGISGIIFPGGEALPGGGAAAADVATGDAAGAMDVGVATGTLTGSATGAATIGISLDATAASCHCHGSGPIWRWGQDQLL